MISMQWFMKTLLIRRHSYALAGISLVLAATDSVLAPASASAQVAEVAVNASQTREPISPYSITLWRVPVR